MYLKFEQIEPGDVQTLIWEKDIRCIRLVKDSWQITKANEMPIDTLKDCVKDERCLWVKVEEGLRDVCEGTNA